MESVHHPIRRRLFASSPVISLPQKAHPFLGQPHATLDSTPREGPRAQSANDNVTTSCLWLCVSRVISTGLSKLILASIGNFSSAWQSDTNHTQGPMSPKRLFSPGWVEAASHKGASHRCQVAEAVPAPR